MNDQATFPKLREGGSGTVIGDPAPRAAEPPRQREPVPISPALAPQPEKQLEAADSLQGGRREVRRQLEFK
jgi:hypothetical protein